MQSSRVMPHDRTGAMVSRSGASARVDTSKRTWSLPLPVQPWATASALCSRAAATMCLTMMGRDSDEISGYLPSYLALALRAGATKSLAYSSLQSTTMASTAPAASARCLMDSKSPPWPSSAASAITSTPSSSTIQRTATLVSSPPLYARTTRFATRKSLSLFWGLQTREGRQPLGHLGPTHALGADDQHRIVTGDSADDVIQPGPVK